MTAARAATFASALALVLAGRASAQAPVLLDPYPPPPPPPPPAQTLTGALRTSLYVDDDRTTVWRGLAALGGDTGRFTWGATASVDVVSSASLDVRASPGLSKVVVVTSASGSTSTSGGSMSDRRIAGTVSAGWHDRTGHALGLSLSAANERDYNSVGAGLAGSYDLFGRLTTLIVGASFNYNWIGSVLDPTLARTMYSPSWTVGVAQVLSGRDVLRLRYDGSAALGYQASPYRYVRFGDWTTTADPSGRLTFAGTLGSANGLPENLPDTRVRHAATLDYLRSLSPSWALLLSARGGDDSWGVASGSGAIEARLSTEKWRLRIGYRFYYQSGATFYRGKYVLAADSYASYTSDKELSRELGHVITVGAARVLRGQRHPRDSRLLLDVTVNILHYDYPDFVLLASRTSGFLELGLTWEP